MPTFEPCKLCGQYDWSVLFERTFSKNQIAAGDDYTRMVFQFIFEKWQPGREEVKFENVLCKRCGFICHFPRLSEQELSLMYTWQRRTEQQKAAVHAARDHAVAQKRSEVIYRYIDGIATLDKMRRVLDFGGDDGSLMQSFLRQNKKCFLIDYSQFAVPGVVKLGDTVYDLRPDEKFDLIVGSHVMEHVVEPLEIMRLLANHLEPQGVFFVEVPFEIWKRPPLQTQPDPLTHINFFTPNSMLNLFALSGIITLKCQLVEYLHTSSNWYPGLRCIGRKCDGGPTHLLRKLDAVNYLKPNLKTYMQFYFSNPKKFKSELFHRIRP